jgi:hypothetical protein
MDFRNHILPVHRNRAFPGYAKGNVQNRASFCRINFVAAKHRIDPRLQTGLAHQSDQQVHGFVRDAVLGVVQKKTRALSGQPLSTARIRREEFA